MKCEIGNAPSQAPRHLLYLLSQFLILCYCMRYAGPSLDWFLSDDVFFNRTGLECVGVVGPEPRLLWIALKALDRRARPGLLLG